MSPLMGSLDATVAETNERDGFFPAMDGHKIRKTSSLLGKKQVPDPWNLTLQDESRQNELLLNRLDLNLLRVFEALMVDGSVTKAARRIGRTQSSVSHSLSKLREMLKDELFVRSGGTMRPTPRARELSVVVSRALQEILSAIGTHVHFNPGKTTRRFLLGLSDSTAIRILPSLGRRFTLDAPNAKLNVKSIRPDDVQMLLHDRIIDCAVLANVSVDEKELCSTVLFREKVVCMAWSKSPRLQVPMTLEAYCKAPHLQISQDGESEGLADKSLREMHLSRNVAMTAPYYMVAPWIIKGTDMIVTMGEGDAQALNPQSETIVFEPPFPVPDLAMSLIYRRAQETDPGIMWMRQILRSVVHERISK